MRHCKMVYEYKEICLNTLLIELFVNIEAIFEIKNYVKITF